LSSGHSLVGNVHLITKVYFPRMFIPFAAVAVRLFDFIIAAVIMAAMLLYHGIAPTWGLLLFPVLVLEMALLALGLGLLSAALNVKYRDIGTLLPVLLQLWMFMSPVIYPSSIVPERWHALYMLNPLAGILENQRAALFGSKFDWTSIFVSTLITVLLLLFSALFFRQAEESLADVI
jgi:lipopolysaccharide transport system permease protein